LARRRRQRPSKTRCLALAALFALLALFALFYLMPLFVMVTTSLKSLEEIRTGSLVALPREVTFEPWRNRMVERLHGHLSARACARISGTRS
jgi:ABC-type glycerol-3-phosphate transport system permease component